MMMAKAEARRASLCFMRSIFVRFSLPSHSLTHPFTSSLLHTHIISPISLLASSPSLTHTSLSTSLHLSLLCMCWGCSLVRQYHSHILTRCCPLSRQRFSRTESVRRPISSPTFPAPRCTPSPHRTIVLLIPPLGDALCSVCSKLRIWFRLQRTNIH